MTAHKWNAPKPKPVVVPGFVIEARREDALRRATALAVGLVFHHDEYWTEDYQEMRKAMIALGELTREEQNEMEIDFKCAITRDRELVEITGRTDLTPRR